MAVNVHKASVHHCGLFGFPLMALMISLGLSAVQVHFGSSATVSAYKLQSMKPVT